ncbi:MAG: GTP cyclohydrolase II [Candidatus Competibacterales bacterium]
MSRHPHQPPRPIVLTSHPSGSLRPIPLRWGAPTALERGPVVGTLIHPGRRNAIGSHLGTYAIYRALGIAAGQLDPRHRPDLTDTTPVEDVGPFPQWHDPERIVSLDPYGHRVDFFTQTLDDDIDVRPTIAITRARLTIPELLSAIAAGRLKPDGKILLETGEVNVTKIAIEPVWYLPGIAQRFKLAEGELRRCLFEQTGSMYSELVTRPDVKVFLPPIGGTTVYAFGGLNSLADPRVPLSCRVHDECNGSDVFGSDICTCRPYLIHGIEVCIETAQNQGAGLIVYNRKEGRALGEVTKFLVYNARKRQTGGDRPDAYFERTECVAGVQDLRFQELMPDVLHWLGITRIDNFISMSNMKYDAIAQQGITIGRRIPIPDELIPKDAHVEIEAKKAAGYYTNTPEVATLARQGRGLADY